MAIVKGVVERLSEKEGKFGLQCGAKVGETWYDLGKTKMGLREGDSVEFQATQNERGYWRIDKGTIKPVEAPVAASVPVGASARAGSTASAYKDNRQDSIVMQSSRKDALEFVKLLVEVGAVDFGKAKGADKQAIAEAYVDKYTDHFVEEVTALKTSPMQSVETETVEDAPKSPAKPKPKPLTENGEGDSLGDIEW